MSVFSNEKQLQEYVYDFSVDGGAQGEIVLSDKAGYSALPEGAIVKSVVAWVESACTSAGSATLSWGNSTDVDGYHAAVAVASLTANAVFNEQDATAALLWDDTNDHQIPYYVDGTAANKAVSVSIATADLTDGKVRLMVEYIMPTRDS